MDFKDGELTVEEVRKLVFGSSSGNLYHDSITLHGRPSHITEIPWDGAYGSGTNADGSPTAGYKLGNVKPGDILEIHYYSEMNGEVQDDSMVYLVVTE